MSGTPYVRRNAFSQKYLYNIGQLWRQIKLKNFIVTLKV